MSTNRYIDPLSCRHHPLDLHPRALEREPDVLGRLLALAAVDLAYGLDDGRRHRRRYALLAALLDDEAVHVVDLGRPALGDVLGHRRLPVAPARRLRGQHLVERLPSLTPAGVRPLLDGGAV